MLEKAHNRAIALEREEHHEVSDIFRVYGKEYHKNNSLSYEQAKVMRHITACRTAALGGHVEVCDECGFRQNAYNSCRDRHCPKCQTLVKEKWINDRKAELLPCGYYHNVFTLPHKLNPVILCNKKVMLDILFSAVQETLQVFARDPQWRLVGTLGFIAVLHTWSQILLDHFHLHCVIPAGVLSFDKSRWVSARKNFLFKTHSLAKEFKKRYLTKVQRAYDRNELIFPGETAVLGTKKGFAELIAEVFKSRWVVYSKKPFAGPEQVLEYLGRYTHRVAISNNRIESIDNGEVTFTYKDREKNDTIEKMTLKAHEFIRRFLLHVLPKGFMKIRYYGFLAHTNKGHYIPLLRELIDPEANLPMKIKETIQEMMLRLTGLDITRCPLCKKGRMVVIMELPRLSWDTS